MKIISYNINDSYPWKVEHIMKMQADVLVVPEITCPEETHLPDGYEMEWKGISYFYNADKPFFLDYAYTNLSVKSFNLLPWDKEMSDHVGMELVI